MFGTPTMKGRKDIDQAKMTKRGRNRRASSIPSGAIASSGSAGVEMSILYVIFLYLFILILILYMYSYSLSSPNTIKNDLTHIQYQFFQFLSLQQ